MAQVIPTRTARHQRGQSESFTESVLSHENTMLGTITGEVRAGHSLPISIAILFGQLGHRFKKTSLRLNFRNDPISHSYEDHLRFFVFGVLFVVM